MQDIPDLSFPLIALDFVFVKLWFHLLRNILGDYNLIIRGWTLFLREGGTIPGLPCTFNKLDYFNRLDYSELKEICLELIAADYSKVVSLKPVYILYSTLSSLKLLEVEFQIKEAMPV